LLPFSFALATPTLPQQQQVVVKLILLITQVAPLTLEGNLNSNMALPGIMRNLLAAIKAIT
jgi:hypothetical protein